MKRFKTMQACLAFIMSILSVFLITGCGSNGQTGHWLQSRDTAKALLTYSFVGYSAYPGTVNEAAKTVAVKLPFGTLLTTPLVATFTTTGVGVTVAGVTQMTGTTANNFTAPVTYRVTAADGTFVDYVVTVTTSLNPAKALLTYSFVGYSAYPGTVNEAAKTVAVKLPFGTDVTDLVANFTTTGKVVAVAGVTQTSGAAASAHDFTAPVTYRVTAADGTFVDYVVTVVTNIPNLGSAAAYGGFGGDAGMTNQGILTVINNGDIGTTGVSTMMTGFHDSTGDKYIETPLNIGNVKDGRIYTDAPPPVIFAAGGPYGGTALTKAIADAAAADTLKAFNYLKGLPAGPLAGAGELGGLTLTAGTYTSATSYKITTGDLTLHGDANDVWVFQMGSSLTVGTPGFPRNVILTGGAQAKNVFWQVGSAARIEDLCNMVGTIIAYSGVTISTAGQLGITTLDGRALATNASVTMVNTIINVPAH